LTSVQAIWKSLEDLDINALSQFVRPIDLSGPYSIIILCYCYKLYTAFTHTYTGKRKVWDFLTSDI